jgi:cytidylate kinase
MLFAVSGSQGSGKSTVIQKLTEVGYPTVERKTSRSILSEWGVTLSQVNNDRELTVQFQEEILKRKLADEFIAAKDISRIWFTERTYADLFTYALVAIGKDNEYSEWMNSYYERCRTAQASYKQNYYIEGGKFAAVADGVRGVNDHYVRLVDRTMVDTLNQFQRGSGPFLDGPTYLLVKEVPVELRVAAILRDVSNYAEWSVVESQHYAKVQAQNEKILADVK